MKNNTTPAPAASASLVLVRAAKIAELHAARHDGLKLGSLVLAPAHMVEAEIERRRTNAGTNFYAGVRYSR